MGSPHERQRRLFLRTDSVREKGVFNFMPSKNPIVVLVINTLAFFVCFACWVLYSVLVTFLVKNDLFNWDQSRIGWLIGVPILTGSIARLPVGALTDRFGGRIIFTLLMLISAAAMVSVSWVESDVGFILGGFGIGLAGASFAVGVANTSAWFRKEKQGTALGIFGAGNLGAALTTLSAPSLLMFFTDHGNDLEAWRRLPQIYAGALVITAILFFVLMKDRVASSTTPRAWLSSLKNPRVWRFGLYYFCLFGGFVALSQWLVPYFVNAYGLSLRTAGVLAASFSLPCAGIRAFGGWISDRWGARNTLYIVFAGSLLCSLFLIIPRLDLPVLIPLVFLQGLLMGIGMGAVYKHIPSYFPGEVGLVGGLVGVIGGLGGFFLPILFGYLLKITGLWSTCWIFFSVLIAVCLIWMHRVVSQILAKEIVAREMEAEVAHA